MTPDRGAASVTLDTIIPELKRRLDAIKRERDRPYEGDNYVAFVDCMARVNLHADAALALVELVEGHDDTCTCPSCYPDWGKS